MKRIIRIYKEYLLLPVYVQAGRKKLHIYGGDRQKLYEFDVPVAGSGVPYVFHYYAPVFVGDHKGECLLLEGGVTEAFLLALAQSDSPPSIDNERPGLHFALQSGWNNDPNGLVYVDGKYHMFFQYNPFDSLWGNMCWGYTTSRDLCHWSPEVTALYPDGDGMIYSGCGMVNERGDLGLPKHAMLLFYTSAGSHSQWSEGKANVQKYAWSTDGGVHFQKGQTLLDTVAPGNRDPKIYWHEETKGYYMVLFLAEPNEFGIFRSQDLQHWEQSGSYRPDISCLQSRECPELRRVPVEGGGYRWVFWSVYGTYVVGEFDGYRFTAAQAPQAAYATDNYRAPQSFWGKEDIVVIPWLTTSPAGKTYGSMMGLPRRLTLTERDGACVLRQSLPEEFAGCGRLLEEKKGCRKLNFSSREYGGIGVRLSTGGGAVFITINGAAVSYEASFGRIQAGGVWAEAAGDFQEFEIIADRGVIEIAAEGGLWLGAFEAAMEDMDGLEISLMSETDTDVWISCYNYI